jgi:hypothetical protein
LSVCSISPSVVVAVALCQSFIVVPFASFGALLLLLLFYCRLLPFVPCVVLSSSCWYCGCFWAVAAALVVLLFYLLCCHVAFAADIATVLLLFYAFLLRRCYCGFMALAFLFCFVGLLLLCGWQWCSALAVLPVAYLFICCVVVIASIDAAAHAVAVAFAITVLFTDSINSGRTFGPVARFFGSAEGGGHIVHQPFHGCAENDGSDSQ